MPAWFIPTERPRREIEEFLRRYAPWRMALQFPGDLRSEDYGRAEPWNPQPTHKAEVVMRHIPAAAIRGQPILDVGFNAGHTALYLAAEYGCRPTGIDIAPRHREVAEWLAAAMDIPARFLLADAQTFAEQKAYAAVFHFGTLYHLPNPLLSLEKSVRSLRPGGWLALETTAYLPDPLVARYIHGLGGDDSNYWALGKGVIGRYLQTLGLQEPQLILEVHPPAFGGEMSRVIYLAHKP